MNAFFCVEDALSRAVVLRIIHSLHPTCYLTELQPDTGGNAEIKKRIEQYNILSRTHSVIIITDLDNWECAPSLRSNWMRSASILGEPNAGLKFCVAVSEIESWIAADDFNFSSYVGASAEHLHIDLESSGAKERILSVVSRYGHRVARQEMTPASARTKVGIGYNRFLIDFVENRWDFEYAATKNRSLRRAVDRIRSAT